MSGGPAVTSRRGFLRQGALWVAGAVVLEEPIKRLWAFPANPLGGRALVHRSNAPVFYGQPVVYYGKIFAIKKASVDTIHVWGEEYV